MEFTVRLGVKDSAEELKAKLWSDVLNAKGRKCLPLSVERKDENSLRLCLDDIETLQAHFKMNMGLLEVSRGDEVFKWFVDVGEGDDNKFRLKVIEDMTCVAK